MDVAFPLIAGIVPAIVSGLAAFFVADRRFKTELRQQRAGHIATLRQRYVSPPALLGDQAERPARRVPGQDGRRGRQPRDAGMVQHHAVAVTATNALIAQPRLAR
jgi:hypothetical protein